MDNKNLKLTAKKPYDKKWGTFTINQNVKYFSKYKSMVVDFLNLYHEIFQQYMNTKSQKDCLKINKHRKSFLFDAAISFKNFAVVIVLAGIFHFAGSSHVIAKSIYPHGKNLITKQIEQKSGTLKLQSLINDSSERMIKGKVIDSESKKPIEGVAILIQNSTEGTVTSKIGEFNLKVPVNYTKKKIKLIFSHFENDTKSVTIRTNQLSDSYTVELKKSKDK